MADKKHHTTKNKKSTQPLPMRRKHKLNIWQGLLIVSVLTNFMFIWGLFHFKNNAGFLISQFMFTPAEISLSVRPKGILKWEMGKYDMQQNQLQFYELLNTHTAIHDLLRQPKFDKQKVLEVMVASHKKSSEISLNQIYSFVEFWDTLPPHLRIKYTNKNSPINKIEMQSIHDGTGNTLDNPSFSKLLVRDDIKLNIQCGDTFSIASANPNKDLESVIIQNHDDTLLLQNSSLSSSLLAETVFGNSTKEIVLTVADSTKLTEIMADKGVDVYVSPCAVNPEKISIHINTGSRVNVQGKTKKLELSMRTGSQFNKFGHQKFMPDKVDIYGSTGTQAYICNAQKITGILSTGSQLKYGQGTKLTDFQHDISSNTPTINCD